MSIAAAEKVVCAVAEFAHIAARRVSDARINYWRSYGVDVRIDDPSVTADHMNYAHVVVAGIILGILWRIDRHSIVGTGLRAPLVILLAATAAFYGAADVGLYLQNQPCVDLLSVDVLGRFYVSAVAVASLSLGPATMAYLIMVMDAVASTPADDWIGNMRRRLASTYVVMATFLLLCLCFRMLIPMSVASHDMHRLFMLQLPE